MAKGKAVPKTQGAGKRQIIDVQSAITNSRFNRTETFFENAKISKLKSNGRDYLALSANGNSINLLPFDSNIDKKSLIETFQICVYAAELFKNKEESSFVEQIALPGKPSDISFFESPRIFHSIQKKISELNVVITKLVNGKNDESINVKAIKDVTLLLHEIFLKSGSDKVAKKIRDQLLSDSSAELAQVTLDFKSLKAPGMKENEDVSKYPKLCMVIRFMLENGSIHPKNGLTSEQILSGLKLPTGEGLLKYLQGKSNTKTDFEIAKLNAI